MLDPRLNHVTAVARFGSFTAAARFIGVTQSAVTKGVSDLERHLGYALFHRTARGALMTEEGREFVERASRLLHDARELLDSPSNKSDPFAGMIRVAAGPASLEWQLIVPIKTFLQRHPNIHFEVTGSTFERVVQHLRSGAIDIAFGLDDAFREWPDLKRSPAGELRPSLFVRHGHPLLQIENPGPVDAVQYNLVVPSDSRPYDAILHSMQLKAGKQDAKLHVVDYFPIVRTIVQNSNAIGVFSPPHVLDPRFERRFTMLDIGLFPSMPMCCAIRKRWEPTAAVRSFVNVISDALANPRRAKSDIYE